MRAYSVFIKNGMRVKHNAKARVTVKSGNQVLEDELTDISIVGGAITRISIMYNRLSMSGGVSWWNPATGMAITRPKISIRTRQEDILTDDQECDCKACEGGKV